MSDDKTNTFRFKPAKGVRGFKCPKCEVRWTRLTWKCPKCGDTVGTRVDKYGDHNEYRVV